MMGALPKVHFNHMGVHATDIDKMEAFYTDVLGFVVSDRGVASFGNRIVFMTQDIEDHHQLVIFDGRPENIAYNPINQISMKLESLGDLRRYHTVLQEAGVDDIEQVDHGNAWSMYFTDPEDNYMEFFVDTPFYTPQPCREPLDVTQSDDEILSRTEAMCRSRPDFKTRSQWQEMIRLRIAENRK